MNYHMNSKAEITSNWLERYTKQKLGEFSKYILLTNFNNYVDLFCEECGVTPVGYDANMRVANGNGVTIINFGMGSPNAALIMDLLSAIKPEACLFLGKCGGLMSEVEVGDFILPVAAIRGDGTSNDYLPPEVPALPSFVVERFVSEQLHNNDIECWAGPIYTTNRRVWEHDTDFKEYLKRVRAMGVDMETATLFTCGFYNEIQIGALLLVSDMPMLAEGVKTIDSDNKVNKDFARTHVRIGIDSLLDIKQNPYWFTYLKSIIK